MKILVEIGVLLILAGMVALEAFMNAMYDNSKKYLSGWINVGFIALVLVGMVWLDVQWQALIQYSLLRYAGFDLVYNKVRLVDGHCLPWNYIGTTKWTDRWMRKFLGWFGQTPDTTGGGMFLLWSKVATLLIALTI